MTDDQANYVDRQCKEDEKICRMNSAKHKRFWGSTPGAPRSITIRDRGACMKFDCINRGSLCDDCFKIKGKESRYDSSEPQCQSA